MMEKDKKRFCLFVCMLSVLVIFLSGCNDKKKIEQIEEASEYIESEEILIIDLETESFIVETESQYIEDEIPEVSSTDFVNVKDYIPNIYVDLKYSTEDNFTGQIIYEFTDAYLRYGTVEKLMKVQEELGEKGYFLKIWDAFRPVEAQFALWETWPDATYVANPNKGFSSHSRGNTIDVTVVDTDGNEIIMPTDFDDFSALADRNYDDCPDKASENAKMLEQIMEENGFKGYFGEWWHYTDIEEYVVEKEFLIENIE